MVTSDKMAGLQKSSSQGKVKNYITAMKAADTRDKQKKAKERKSNANKESKEANCEAQKEEIKIMLSNKKAIDDLNKVNQETKNMIKTKLDSIETLTGTTMKEAIKYIGKTIVKAVIEGIEASKDKVKETEETTEDHFSTQKLADDDEKAMSRINKPIQPTGINLPVREKIPDIPNIYPTIIREELCTTMNILIDRVNQLQAQLNSNTETDPANGKVLPKKPDKQPKYLPAVNIATDGTEEFQQKNSEDNQPLDFTLVKPARQY